MQPLDTQARTPHIVNAMIILGCDVACWTRDCSVCTGGIVRGAVRGERVTQVAAGRDVVLGGCSASERIQVTTKHHLSTRRLSVATSRDEHLLLARRLRTVLQTAMPNFFT